MENMNPDIFLQLCDAHGLPRPVPEFRFCERKWKFDWAWCGLFVALEVEGGVWRRGGGAHSRPSGILRDIEKYNAATVMGWRIIRATPQQVKSGEIFPVLQELLIPEREGAA